APSSDNVAMEIMLVTRPVRVVLADDHPMIRRGLRLILEDSEEVDVIAEAGNGQELLDLVDQMDPDVVVVDVGMPKLAGLEALSQREHDVLQLLAFGKTNKEIAKELGIGAQTVKTHISHIFTKMGAADRTDAVALALRKGLVQ